MYAYPPAKRMPWCPLAALLLLAGQPANGASELCDPFWAPLGSGIGQPYPYAVFALAVFDNGTGPALYVGGDFTTAGGVTVNHVAKWNGATWSALGSGTNGAVHAFAVFDDGSGPVLYVGGAFTQAGGIAANCIGRWDGAAWSALGPGLNGAVFALAVFDDDGAGLHPPALYAGGGFTASGTVSLKYIAKWGVYGWTPVGTGIDAGHYVSALAVFDEDRSGPQLERLFAGGLFTYAGGLKVNSLGRWDGWSWSSVGGGLDGISDPTVLALLVHDEGSGPALYTAGHFTTAGATQANYVARWNGLGWFALGSGVAGGYPRVSALATFDDSSGSALYVGGNFTTAGGVSCPAIARWDGSTWSDVGGGFAEAGYTEVHALASLDDDGAGPHPPTLYAAGSFTSAGADPASYMAAWTVRPCGDLNCDAVLNAFDIDPFVMALIDPAAYALKYPYCEYLLGDINDDGTVDAFDIDPFVDLLTGAG